jgi:hypothetical protein
MVILLYIRKVPNFYPKQLPPCVYRCSDILAKSLIRAVRRRAPAARAYIGRARRLPAPARARPFAATARAHVCVLRAQAALGGLEQIHPYTPRGPRPRYSGSARRSCLDGGSNRSLRAAASPAHVDRAARSLAAQNKLRGICDQRPATSHVHTCEPTKSDAFMQTIGAGVQMCPRHTCPPQYAVRGHRTWFLVD